VNDGTINVFDRIEDLKAPLFLIYGIDDPFTPKANGEQCFEALPTDDKRYLLLSRENGYSADYNHVDLAFSIHGREEVFTPIRDWLREHAMLGQSGQMASIVAAQRSAGLEGDTSWRKALRKAAEVMTGMSDEDMDAVGEPLLSTNSSSWGEEDSPVVEKSKPARRKAAAKDVSAAMKSSTGKPTAKKSTAKKPAAKKKAATKAKARKSTAKSKASKSTSNSKKTAKKSAATSTNAKKSAVKKSTAKKSGTKKKATAKKKPATKNK